MTATIYRSIPDSAGHNAYNAAPDFAQLLRLYATNEEVAHVELSFEQLGALVGDELEQPAPTADKNKPALAVRHRNASPPNGIDKHPAYVQLERYVFSHYGLAAMSHRAGVFDWPAKWPPTARASWSTSQRPIGIFGRLSARQSPFLSFQPGGQQRARP